MVTLLLCVGVVVFLAGIVLVVVGLCVAAGANEADDWPVQVLEDDEDGSEVVQTRRDVRDALDCVLADDAEVCRRLEPVARANSDLAALPRQLEGLYVLEVER